MNAQDELFSFVDDDIKASTNPHNLSSWRILIADDDVDVHDPRYSRYVA